MRIPILLCMGVCLAAVPATLASASAYGPEVNRRMDCRFHATSGQGPRFCYASATYEARFESGAFRYNHVRYAVGCDRQTLFEDAGVIRSEDHPAEFLRPEVADASPVPSVPMVELEEVGALARVGTYEAKLELASGGLYRGRCYVGDLTENGGQPRIDDPVRE